MENLYDVHCHMFPGVDDGANDEYEMIKMIQIAYHEGIRTIIFTPHYHPYRGCADAETVMRDFRKIARLVHEYFPDMELYEGNEIYYRSDVVQKLKQGEILTLAGSKYVLVEFSTDADAAYIRDALSDFLFAGYYPVIAHIERYDSLMEDLEKVEELIESGVYVQINVGSVIGTAGGKIKKNVKKLLKADMVHFIGTDAHDEKRRAPLMQKCIHVIEKKYGTDTAERILHKNPSYLIQNKII